jgi:hypothetical protein
MCSIGDDTGGVMLEATPEEGSLLQFLEMTHLL